MFEALTAKGYQIEFHSHARAIVSADFPGVADELEAALLATTIPIEEIIAGGGGEAKGTQRLRNALTALAWPKTEFIVERSVNGVRRESQSHIVDHVRQLETGERIALEIEWNNKDPFFDRDLENFKRLHADGAISVGVVVTRGRSLHEGMRGLVRRFLDERGIQSFEEMAPWGYEPTSRQKRTVQERVGRGATFQEAFTGQFVSDKFGEATTHWRKLEDRMHRGVGNPCPLILIGLPDTIVTFHEGVAALAEVEAAEATEDSSVA
ncbi:MAG: BglII/BstYI family type II restriction endonuclease [Janthinobacterium lividum]